MFLGWTAAQAARKATALDIDRLRAAVATLGAAQSAAAIQAADFDVFSVLVTATGNRVLALFSNALREVYNTIATDFVTLYAPDRFDLAPHRRLLECVEVRDAAGARAAMRAHGEAALAAVEAR